MVRRCEPQTPADYGECFRSDPSEELRFSLANGELVSRADIRAKYADQEKRLIHELELAENDSSADEVSRIQPKVSLAHFYEDRGQFEKAKEYYDEAMPAYIKAFGLEYPSVAVVVGEAATNCRKLKNHGCSDTLFRHAVEALDKDQKDPNSVSPAAITLYEEYAILLRELNRIDEATRMEKRANELRAANPDYKRSKRY